MLHCMFFQSYDYHCQHEYEFLENNALLRTSSNRIQSSLVSSLWCRALDESADLTRKCTTDRGHTAMWWRGRPRGLSIKMSTWSMEPSREVLYIEIGVSSFWTNSIYLSPFALLFEPSRALSTFNLWHLPSWRCQILSDAIMKIPVMPGATHFSGPLNTSLPSKCILWSTRMMFSVKKHWTL